MTHIAATRFASSIVVGSGAKSEEKIVGVIIDANIAATNGVGVTTTAAGNQFDRLFGRDKGPDLGEGGP